MTGDPSDSRRPGSVHRDRPSPPPPDPFDDPWREPDPLAEALVDPWREPGPFDDPWRSPAAHTGPSAVPAIASRTRGGRSGRPTLLLSMVVALLLGGLIGGVTGYRIAERGPVTTLGADRGDGPALLAQAPPDSVAAVVQQVLPSVVTIRTEQGRERGVGSGFVVSADGHILTNEHVVSAAAGPVTVIFYDGVETPATMVGKDPESDIAVLQVSRTDLTPVRLGDSDAVSVGDPVLAFGSPLALDNTVTAGIVSAVDRPIESGAPGGVTRYYAAIQTDAAVNQGNSGGPLVDAAGRVIGINSVIKSVAAGGAGGGSIGLAFAIPVRQAERVAAQIIDTGEVNRTVIGAELAAAEGDDDAGVRLGDVTPLGPADRAGLRAGDVVTRLNGRPLYAPGDLVALVRKQPAGQVVTVHYRRGETEQSATVTLTAERR